MVAGPRAGMLAASLVAIALLPRAGGPAPAALPAAAARLPQELDSLVVTASPVITPRPATVPGVANPILSLNGTWEFSPAKGVAPKPIEVPGEWAMQGFEVPSGGFATYTRRFDVPADWQGRTVKLRFDAVHAVCGVLVNGQPVGGHEGGFVPFELDVTNAIRPGGNEIVVRVLSESVADSVSCISQYAAHQVGGIVRKVTLFAVPRVFVSKLWYETAVTGADARVTVHADFAQADPMAKHLGRLAAD